MSTFYRHRSRRSLVVPDDVIVNTGDASVRLFWRSQKKVGMAALNIFSVHAAEISEKEHLDTMKIFHRFFTQIETLEKY